MRASPPSKLVPSSHALSASSACTSTKNSDSAPDTTPATHVAPPSAVRANAPFRPPAHATSESTAARPRNSALLPVGWSTHWAAAPTGAARPDRRAQISRTGVKAEAGALVGATTAARASSLVRGIDIRSLRRGVAGTRGAPRRRARDSDVQCTGKERKRRRLHAVEGAEVSLALGQPAARVVQLG